MLTLEILRFSAKEIPDERLGELYGMLCPAPNTSISHLNSSSRNVYYTARLYLDPERLRNHWRDQIHDYQLILWQGVPEDRKIVGELYGAFKKDSAHVYGIHSDMPLGGTILMAHFAKLAQKLPISLNAMSDAFEFYEKLGLRPLKSGQRSGEMIWPQRMKQAAAQLAKSSISPSL